MTDVVEPEKKGWLSRLRDGLSKSTKRVTESITGLFTKKKLDQKTLDDLEDALIQADLGVSVAGVSPRSSPCVACRNNVSSVVRGCPIRTTEAASRG